MPVDIDLLVERFFEGETTLAEEASLQSYFEQNAVLPPHLERLRPMMGWFANGCSRAVEPVSRRRTSLREILLAAASVAAALIAVVSTMTDYRSLEMTRLSYEGSFIKSDEGHMLNNINVILPNVLAEEIESVRYLTMIENRIEYLENY